MSPDQIALIRRSFAGVADDPAAFGDAFYDALFRLDPDLRHRFPTDRAAQSAKLVAALATVLESLHDLAGLLPMLEALGAAHGHLGIRPAHYGLAHDALLTAFADRLGAELTPAAAEAWSLAYNLVAEAMQQGAATGTNPNWRQERAADARF